MKALTICQPFAHLIVTLLRELPIGSVEKRCENRTWWTDYRGQLAIHAGKSTKWMKPGDRADYPEMAFGAVVGVADLLACVCIQIGASGKTKVSDSVRNRFPWIENHFHAEGPAGWILGNVRRFREPIKATGHQWLWEWDAPDGWESLIVDA